MKAIKIIEDAKAELQTVPLPKMREDYILCKVNCVALNPTDWKHIDKGHGVPGCTVGCDFSGVVEEIGSAVTKGWKKGDRVASFVHGSNRSQPQDGCFAEYCVAKGDLGMKIPDSMSDEDAATLPTGIVTCGQSMYQNLRIVLPGFGKQDNFLLIYGGSTATGTLAIQYAVLSGCRVIATASKQNFALLKARGAEAVFDYKDPQCGRNMRKYTSDQLTLAFDCIAEGDSSRICEEAMSSNGGLISDLLPFAHHARGDVQVKVELAYTVLGEPYDKFGRHQPAKIDDYEYAKDFWKISERLIKDGKIKPHPKIVGSDSLQGVFDGLQQLRDGSVSGVKMVYPV